MCSINKEVGDNMKKVKNVFGEGILYEKEDLGKKINERVSVITRIETGKMTPDTKLTKKLERTLDITLLEKVDNIDLNQFINNSSGERTLGNIMKIKRN